VMVSHGPFAGTWGAHPIMRVRCSLHPITLTDDLAARLSPLVQRLAHRVIRAHQEIHPLESIATLLASHDVVVIGAGEPVGLRVRARVTWGHGV